MALKAKNAFYYVVRKKNKDIDGLYDYVRVTYLEGCGQKRVLNKIGQLIPNQKHFIKRR